MDAYVSCEAICKLNHISTKSKVFMKFEKHPKVQTGVVLKFGNKTYETVEKSTKLSRIKAAEKALEEYYQIHNDIENMLPVTNPSPIGKVYEISQKLNKKVYVEYTHKLDQGFAKSYLCRVSFDEVEAESTSSSKKAAKENAFKILFQKISPENSDDVQKDFIPNYKNDDSFQDEFISGYFNPRDYQEEIYLQGLDANIIICLGTGTGKTFISVLLIKHFLSKMLLDLNKKKIVFLAPTTALVYQQSNHISSHLACNVGIYCGDYTTSTWCVNSWKSKMDNQEVLVMTPEIFRQLLQHGIIRPSDVSLLIFDECHHGVKIGHPYNIIMTLYFLPYMNTINSVRIIGLTASPVPKSSYSNFVLRSDIINQIKKLECIYSAKCVTAKEYLASLKRCFAKPQVNIILHKKMYINDDLTNNIKNFLNDLKRDTEADCDRNYHTTSSGSSDSCFEYVVVENAEGDKTSHKVSINPPKVKKHCTRVYLRCNEVVDELGVYPLLLHCKELQGIFNNIIANKSYAKFVSIFSKMEVSNRKLIAYLDQKVSDILSVIKVKTFESLSQTPLFSHKLKSLLALLCKHYPLPANSTYEKRDIATTIVFVKRRDVASILSLVINAIAVMESVSITKMPRFASNYVVGVAHMHSLKKLSNGIADITLKTVKARIESFKHSAFDILCATNVLEEGIDVQSCNVVVRFDPFTHLGSYIQTKGRIRCKQSHFYAIESEENAQSIRSMINNFFKAEIEVENVLSQITDNTDENQSDDYYGELEGEETVLFTTRSKMDLRSAVSFIYRYCDSHSPSLGYHVRPVFFFENKDLMTRANLKLPSLCGIPQVIQSRWLTNPKIAKQQASLLAVKLMLSRGLVDENFLPPGINKDKTIMQKYSTTEQTENNKTSRDISEPQTPLSNIYKITYPKSLINTNNQANFYVYQLSLNQLKVCSSKINTYQKISAELFQNDFVILIPHTIPNLSFPLSSPVLNFQLSLTLSTAYPLTLSLEKYNAILEFNKHIFVDLLKIIPKSCVWAPTESLFTIYVALLGKDEQLDYPSMKKFVEFQQNVNNRKFMNCAQILKDSPAIENTSILKNYGHDQTIYPVCSLSNFTSSSFIPSTTITFSKYYHSKYGIKLKDDEFFFDCFGLPKHLNFLTKVNGCCQRKSLIIQLPQSCVVRHPLSSSLILKFYTLPSIMKRLVNFLRISEWCINKLEISTFEMSSSDLNCYIHDKCSSFAQISITPQKPNFDQILDGFCRRLSYTWNSIDMGYSIPFYSLFIAFSHTSTLESVNYERYETLGDSILKMLISLVVFTSNMEKDEGFLTSTCSRYVSNNYLQNISSQLGLEKLIICKNLIYGKNWCPPNCQIINENLENISESCHSDRISSKTIADVLESFIGSIFLTTGFNNMYFMLNQLNIFEDLFKNQQIETFSDLINKIEHSVFNYQKLEDIMFDIDSVEKIINYKFRNKHILAQALTHASAILYPGQVSYDALEFIGDAILGFMITLYFYDYHEESCCNPLSPHAISHSRSALVNNKIIGIIAAKSGILKCLNNRAYPLHLALKQLISAVETLECGSNIHEFPFVGLASCHNILDGSINKSFSCEVLPIPKPAADVFESLIGAVFIDSSCDMTLTSRIFLPFFKYYIELYKEEFPINPNLFVVENHKDLVIRTEKNGGKFTEILKLPESDIEFIGHGMNIEDAHTAACYCFLKFHRHPKSC